MNRLLGHLIYVTVGLDFSECLDAFLRNDFHQWDTSWSSHLPFYEEKDGQRQWLVSYLSLQGLQHYLNGKFDAFFQVLDHMKQELLPQDLPENQVAFETLEGLSHFHREEWTQAETLFVQAIERLEKSPHAILFGNPYLWLAHLYYKKGWKRQACQILEDMFSQYRMDDIGAILLREGKIVGPLLELVEHHPAARRMLRLWQKLHRPRTVSGHPMYYRTYR